MKKTTIIDAIKIVLVQNKDGMTVEEIFSSFVRQNLYSFKAKLPKNVLNTEVRRHCLGLDFPTSYPIKHFYIIKIVNGKPLYALLEKNRSVKVIRTKYR